jgi:D-3-phosphoglycerate dehydrogenase
MVANLPGINAQSVAEYCAMAMLMLARRILRSPALAVEDLGRGARARRRRRELAGMTVGIVGVGEIGGRLAKDRAQRASA